MRRITLDSECRYDSRKKIGDPGVEYEFDIKIPPLGVDMTADEFDYEAQDALIQLGRALKKRYPWTGRWYQTGRSGGWFAFTDEHGEATKAKLQTIIGMIEQAKEKFCKRLERQYPR